MGTLYEIANDYQQLLDLSDSVDPDEMRVFNDTLEAVLGSMDIKMDDYAVVLTHMEGNQKLLEAERDRLQARIDRLEANRKRMKDALKGAMILTDRRKIDTGRYKFSICKNGGQLPVVLEKDVPDSYMKVIMEVDMAKIRKALDGGEALDFARFGERGEHLRIS